MTLWRVKTSESAGRGSAGFGNPLLRLPSSKARDEFEPADVGRRREALSAKPAELRP